MLGALWGLFVVLVVLWLLGFVVFHVTSLPHSRPARSGSDCIGLQPGNAFSRTTLIIVYRAMRVNTASNGVTNLELPRC